MYHFTEVSRQLPVHTPGFRETPLTAPVSSLKWAHTQAKGRAGPSGGPGPGGAVSPAHLDPAHRPPATWRPSRGCGRQSAPPDPPRVTPEREPTGKRLVVERPAPRTLPTGHGGPQPCTPPLPLPAQPAPLIGSDGVTGRSEAERSSETLSLSAESSQLSSSPGSAPPLSTNPSLTHGARGLAAETEKRVYVSKYLNYTLLDIQFYALNRTF